jgi:hypothetical protein
VRPSDPTRDRIYICIHVTAFWVLLPYCFYWLDLLFDPEDRGGMAHRNVSELLLEPKSHSHCLETTKTVFVQICAAAMFVGSAAVTSQPRWPQCEYEVEVEVEVTLRPKVSRPVRLGVRPHLGPTPNFSFSLRFSLDSCWFLIL